MVAKISMADAKAEFDALYKQATTEDESRLVLVIDCLKIWGKQLGMGYTRKLPFKAVIPHRRNRDGAMALSKEALNIWDDIDRVGVSVDLYKGATCFEEPQSRDNETKFLELCAMDPMLPDYKKGEIECASVACTHWNISLASAEEQKVPLHNEY